MLPNSVLILFLLLSLLSSSAGHASGDHSQNPSARIPLEGAQIFQHHCATCHGSDATRPWTNIFRPETFVSGPDPDFAKK